MKSILVISQEAETIGQVQSCFRAGYKVASAADKAAAFELLRKKRHDFILIDIEILRDSTTGEGYKAALQPFWHLYPTVEIVVMTRPEMIREAVMAVKAGASNYLTYPLNPDEVKYVIESIYEMVIMQSELDYLRDKFWHTDDLDVIKTRNALMKKVFEKIRSVAPTKSTVLLIGETGTGKSLLAELIHEHSNRRGNKFISVHCGAIPDTLLESELFGHEKGAFTGAIRRRLGRFEIAKGGTIFLDEIGTVTPSAQIKLLQILQDGTFQRVGGEESIEANVRIIAATNTDLKKMCDSGQFRSDLYYRLNVFPIEIPPLNERIEDIPLLVEGFLKKLNKFYTKQIYDVHPYVMEAFEKYSWPGNIRELENLLERAYILESSSMLTPESFPSELFVSESPRSWVSLDTSISISEARRRGIEQVEVTYLNGLLSAHKGKIEQSARAAGITSRQLHKLMKKYGLRKEDFKESPVRRFGSRS
ncbi:MAG: sigma-54-dependent Fis family transcriptional regulator [Candidatus Abyssobacteria bacterium SURF_5]|uniref:Sigma-54-dependent Fis family transcriptional regulator n=1 Tax=Abyssobacteria bacterium (strain SURF_5) TaxID=2093360 RepID=A0A3A4P4S3_ABYX5|nr:MAG: sigma-54-dependent Fis family transcriptional regulator [Candidatus Abyssubacteria bacterium SURF_5]